MLDVKITKSFMWQQVTSVVQNIIKKFMYIIDFKFGTYSTGLLSYFQSFQLMMVLKSSFSGVSSFSSLVCSLPLWPVPL